jgi:hypothetical protein
LTDDELNDHAVELGCVLGEQLVRAFAWEWKELHKESGFKAYSVVASDRSMAMFPMLYLRQILADQALDNTTLLLFNMLGSSRFRAVPGAYQVIA